MATLLTFANLMALSLMSLSSTVVQTTNTNFSSVGISERKGISFVEKPPRVHVNEVGKNITFHCIPDQTNETTNIQIDWVFPPEVQDLLSTDVADTFIKVNHSKLIFLALQEEFAGYYKCILSDGERRSVAVMRLHVLRIHTLNVKWRIIVGAVSCACAALIFGAIILIQRLYSRRISGHRKQVELKHYESEPLN